MGRRHDMGELLIPASPGSIIISLDFEPGFVLAHFSDEDPNLPTCFAIPGHFCEAKRVRGGIRITWSVSSPRKITWHAKDEE